MTHFEECFYPNEGWDDCPWRQGRINVTGSINWWISRMGIGSSAMARTLTSKPRVREDLPPPIRRIRHDRTVPFDRVGFQVEQPARLRRLSARTHWHNQGHWRTDDARGRQKTERLGGAQNMIGDTVTRTNVRGRADQDNLEGAHGVDDSQVGQVCHDRERGSSRRTDCYIMEPPMIMGLPR